MSDWLRTAPVTELVKERTTFLRGVQAVKYSTPAERVYWALKVEEITEELTRRNELKS
jgi:hypothetical protein